MRIGLISDTHQPAYGGPALWPEIPEVFRGVDLILHAGDIVHPVVLDWLEEVADVIAVRGNNDVDWNDHRMYDRIAWLDAAGVRIGMVHAVEPETRPIPELRRLFFDDEHIDVMITGDTHVERIDHRDGVLQINSGSPTLPRHWSPRRGTVGLLEVAQGRVVEASIVRLQEAGGLKNPGVEYRYTPHAGVVRLDSR